MRRSNLVVVERTVECNRCGVAIAFLKSKKTGRYYPVDVLKDSSADVLVASPFGFHKCGVTKPEPNARVASREEQHGPVSGLWPAGVGRQRRVTRLLDR